MVSQSEFLTGVTKKHNDITGVVLAVTLFFGIFSSLNVSKLLAQGFELGGALGDKMQEGIDKIPWPDTNPQ
ncbi:MAG: hypothetical protein WBL68_00910 [Nitrososphaeraceae archaeon]